MSGNGTSATHLYIPINKCANSSFKQMFAPYRHILVPSLDAGTSPMTNLRLLRKSAAYSRLIKFTVVRNPISRFLSAVNMFIRDRRLDSGSAVKDTIRIIQTHQSYTLTSPQRDFASYAKRHTLPLTHSLYGLLPEHSGIAPDYVLKLENYEHRRTEFLDFLCLPETTMLPRANAAKNVIGPEDLDADDVQFLLEYYARDFDVFDYPKPSVE